MEESESHHTLTGGEDNHVKTPADTSQADVTGTHSTGKHSGEIMMTSFESK